jgi:sugar lactone lactonase YvrE
MPVMTFRLISAVLTLLAFTALTNTALGATTQISGALISGNSTSGIPLPGVPITLYVLNSNDPTPIASTLSDANGHFALDMKNPTPSGSYYVTAQIGTGVELNAFLGPTPTNTPITINEQSSVSAAYVLAQFSRSGRVKGTTSRLAIASHMTPNLVDLASGDTSPVLKASPNGDESISLRTLHSLSNLLTAVVRNHLLAPRLFALTPNEQGDKPNSTSTALSNLARNPSQNVKAIYHLSRLSHRYPMALRSTPDAWILAVKVNNSGDSNRLIAGMGNIVFDKNGYAWITNNVVQGTTGSSDFLVLLKPDGKPSDGTNGYLPSPLLGGGILGQGFGITIDSSGSVWTGNFGWGGVNPSDAPPGSGSLSLQGPNGATLSQPNGYYAGTYRAQSLDTDSKGNLWIASYGNSKVCVFLAANPANSLCFTQPTDTNPFGLKVASDDTIWVANTGGGLGKNAVKSSVAKFALQGNTITQLFEVSLGQSIKGLSLDSSNNAWIASGGDNKVYALAPNGQLIGSFSGGGMSGPWSTIIDGEDNVWVANFGPLSGNFPKGRLTKLNGATGKGRQNRTPSLATIGLHHEHSGGPSASRKWRASLWKWQNKVLLSPDATDSDRDRSSRECVGAEQLEALLCGRSSEESRWRWSGDLCRSSPTPTPEISIRAFFNRFAC